MLGFERKDGGMDTADLTQMTPQEVWELYIGTEVDDLDESPSREDIVENAKMFDETLTPIQLKIIVDKCLEYYNSKKV